MTASAHPPSAIAQARKLFTEGREADAAALLEHEPSPEAAALHRQIAIKAATAALKSKETAAASAWLDRGLSLSPQDPVLNFFRGNLYIESGYTEDAVACFRRCIAAQPRREEFVCNLGHALVLTRRHEEAVSILRTLPDSATAQLNLGAAHERSGDIRKAASAYEAATRLKADLFAAWLNLGAARERLHELPAALSAYNHAVGVSPTSARAHFERGGTLAKMKSFTEAIASFERCLARDPSYTDARLALVGARLRLCDWRDLPTLRRDVVEPLLARTGGDSTPSPFILQTLPGAVTQAELRRIAEQRASRLARQASPLRSATPVPTGRPLRVGYVSPDFGNHAVGNCLRTLFAHHDKTRVSVHAFSLVHHGDCATRAALQAGCDTWDNLDDIADRAAAERIASREIDILVDLAGHTKSGRLALFAWRPAPRQVTWLGYPGTTGSRYIDYLFADEHLIPPEEESAFTERIVRLPGCYLPTDDAHPMDEGGSNREAHGLPKTGFVFCAFNNTYKIEPFIFGLWMETLRRTPGSVLWLRGTDEPTAANLRREAESRGIAAGRLVFDNRSLPRAAHLARHKAADLYLDTHFYNAHSTAADALQAGLPVLTFPGRSFPSRVGLSLVSTLGLADELVATSMEDYVERSVALATEPDRLAALRARLAEAITRPGGLFDTTAFARKLETAYALLCGRPR